MAGKSAFANHRPHKRKTLGGKLPHQVVVSGFQKDLLHTEKGGLESLPDKSVPCFNGW